MSSLNSHPHAVVYGEMFPGQSYERQRHLMEALIAGKPLEKLSARALPERFRHPGTGTGTRCDAVGFKTKLRDVADAGWFGSFLREHRFKAVHLRRLNRVKHALSLIGCRALREQTGLFNAVAPEQTLGSLAVDPEVLLENCRRADADEREAAAYAEALGLETHRITYESLVADEAGVFSELLRFLGLEPFELKSKIYKNIKDDLREAIRNFDEVAARLAGTPYESDLHQPNC